MHLARVSSCILIGETQSAKFVKALQAETCSVAAVAADGGGANSQAMPVKNAKEKKTKAKKEKTKAKKEKAKAKKEKKEKKLR